MTWALEILKMFTLIGSFCAKYITFDLKTYREIIFHETEEWCKIWGKTDLWSEKLHEGFDKFLTKHSKVSKICTLMGSFWRKYIMLVLKKYRRDIFHDTEEWCEIWRKLTCGLENDIRNSANFNTSTQKSQYRDFGGIL